MGCCLSTPNEKHRRRPAAPTISPADEETVKEVLLETPITFPKVSITNETDREKPAGNQELIKAEAAASFKLGAAKEIKYASVEKPSEQVKEIELVSEMCSVTGSLSNATENVEGDDGCEGNRRLPSAVKRHSDQVVRKRAPPPRLAPRSPEKKFPAKRNVEAEKKSRKGREASEDVLNRGELVEHRNVNENGSGMEAAAAGVNDRLTEAEEDLEIETLENPVVSFECFIFL